MGLADGPARTGSRIAIHSSRTAPRTVVRRVSTLDLRTDQNVTINVTVSIRTTPKLGYKEYQVDNDNIQRGDTYILIAALDVEELGFPMTLDEQSAARSTVTMIVQEDDQHWNVKTIEVIESGDEIAAYKLQLRR